MEERVAIMQRMLEIMQVLLEQNNFNGVLSITSALNSSAVHRLISTKEKLPSYLLKALEDNTNLISDHFRLYLEKLRSINPPCVPFFGQYQSNILFLEEGNPDTLMGNPKLINFSKRRKVAEIISEIQQYQNQPYCLSIYHKLRTWLENLDPLYVAAEEYWMTDKEFTDYLWQRSIEIEPRNNDTIKRRAAERKWPGLSLRSPGIKPKNLPGKNHPNPLPKILSGSGSRVSEDDSPLPSPSFGSPSQVFNRQSPASTPATPGYQTTSSAIEDVKEDPVKMPVMLPCAMGSTSLPPNISTKPPPLPPKPRPGSTLGDLPPLPPPRDSSPPPPLPPRGNLTTPTLTRAPFSVQPKRNSTMDSNTSLPPAIVPRNRVLSEASASPSGRWGDPHPSLPITPSASPLSRTLPPHTPTSNVEFSSWIVDRPPPLPPFNTLPSNGPSSGGNRPLPPFPLSSSGPVSAGPEMGSHFTFGHHVAGLTNRPLATIESPSSSSDQGGLDGLPQIPPRPPPYRQGPPPLPSNHNLSSPR